MSWKDIIKNEKPTFRLGASGRKKLTPEMEKDIEYVVNVMMEKPEMSEEVRRLVEELAETLGEHFRNKLPFEIVNY
mgnify:FL=1|jgi:hypothetical protein